MQKQRVLHNLLLELKAGRFRPRAVRRFVREGIRHGIELAWSLKSLRRSFYVAEAFMFLVLLAMGSILHFAFPKGLHWLTVVATLALFVKVFGLTLLQLGLVRAESSGQFYEKFTFPNVLTLLRLLVIPYIIQAIVVGKEGLGAAAFIALVVFATGSDSLDGTLARIFKKQSDFGRIYDPIVDLLFHSSVAIALYAVGDVGKTYLVFVLVRFLLPPLVGTVLYMTRAPFQVKATIMGKITSVVLCVLLFGIAVDRLYEIPNLSWWLHTVLEPLSVASCAGNLIVFVIKGMRIARRAD